MLIGRVLVEINFLFLVGRRASLAWPSRYSPPTRHATTKSVWFVDAAARRDTGDVNTVPGFRSVDCVNPIAEGPAKMHLVVPPVCGPSIATFSLTLLTHLGASNIVKWSIESELRLFSGFFWNILFRREYSGDCVSVSPIGNLKI